jgi:hypothetical protein
MAKMKETKKKQNTIRGRSTVQVSFKPEEIEKINNICKALGFEYATDLLRMLFKKFDAYYEDRQGKGILPIDICPAGEHCVASGGENNIQRISAVLPRPGSRDRRELMVAEPKVDYGKKK